MWRMGIRNSFTMEATFCGSTLGKKRGTHFNTKDLESMGYHFCDSLLDYCDPDRNKKKHLKTKKERNSTIARRQNGREEQEVCDKGHLVQRHKESNSDVKDTRPNASDDRIFDYFRRQIPNQTLDLHHNLKSKMKPPASFQSKKTGVNWTDDEKRIYRDIRIAQTEELLHSLIPIMEGTKHMPTAQIKQTFDPRTSLQIQPRLNPATYGNINRYSTPQATSEHLPLINRGNLKVSSSKWLQSLSQRSFEGLSPLKGHKKRSKHSRIKAINTPWETPSSSFEKDANIIKGKSLQAEEYSQQSSVQIGPHLAENKDEQPTRMVDNPSLT
ncbi:cytosolic carboxypeptidase 3 isoform X4 [Saccopteryx leptura]|uniref:cytosolic carboxypeptidase 3 isoform X4 n=1 Tax=Saccopteryx leptura TaxID=249018 RepID=UPI00339C7306